MKRQFQGNCMTIFEQDGRNNRGRTPRVIREEKHGVKKKKKKKKNPIYL